MSTTHSIETHDALALLKQLIAVPSFSKEEADTAEILEAFLSSKNVKVHRCENNVWATSLHFDAAKPSLLLNSHHDTVQPNHAYTLDPFSAIEKQGRLYGLGSNDAGGSLVALLATFLHYCERSDLSHNLLFAATAEEEISGSNGIEKLLPELPAISFGIVGEPTQMQMAIAERGLLVLDVTCIGKAGHAAREEGENALYQALEDIHWFRNYRFPEVSELLGPVKMSVTVIDTKNKAHNVVPAECRFVVDVRVNECYTFETILDTIRQHVKGTVVPRSLRMRSSSIAMDHPVVRAGLALGRTVYGSPTTSDKALMPFPTLKMGPGDSARSHTADEYIYTEEIEEGIKLYRKILDQLL